MASGLRLACERVRVESNRAPCFPPDILPGRIARAGAGVDVGKDHRTAMDWTIARLLPAPLMYSTGNCRRGKTHGSPLSIALVLHGLSRERF